VAHAEVFVSCVVLDGWFNAYVYKQDYKTQWTPISGIGQSLGV